VLIPFFDVRVVSRDYGFRKPDPRLFQVALTVLDVAPEEAVFIGDHIYRDVCGAQEVGMQAVWLNRSGQPSHDKRRCGDVCLDKRPDAPPAGRYRTSF